MNSVPARTKAALIAAGLVALMSASPAAAATTAAAPTTTPFGCRASVVRATLLNALTIEPTIANSPTAPCVTDTHGVSAVNVPQTGQEILHAGPAGAFTHSDFAAGSTISPGASAVADVEGVVIPTTTGSVTVVGPVEANASYACSNGNLTSSSGSTLDIIYVNGTKMTLPAPGTPETIQLGGGSYIAVNEKITTSTSITERVLDVHLAGIADVVVGEAKVTLTRSDPCAGTTGPPPNTNACPPGSTLDPARLLCIITLPGGKIIIVGPPFTGPSGGTVLAVSVARKKYKSPCLNGPGPKYVLVATKPHGRVTGTPRSDRILALGAFERVAASGGNDCVDGKAKRLTIWDGNGKDRIYGGPGETRIGTGNGNSKIWGRNGSDWITAGNGNDWLYGGSLSSRIDVGLGKSHVFGGPNNNRIYAASGHAAVSCGSGKHNVAYLRNRAAVYGAKHGCQKIYFLR
jgi:Ca2+-binding RTX toxin-like protein